MRRRWLSALVVAVSALALLPATPALAQGPEYLYEPTDPYLALRVQEVTDTSDVLLAVRFRPTVSGTVSGVRICLDLTMDEVSHRLPVLGSLWTEDGQLLASGGASEGLGYAAPCWYRVGLFSLSHLQADQTYVVGFWLRGGQYSYVPHGFDSERTNGAHLTASGSLYAYSPPLTAPPFPTDSWENADYLVSPEFTPDAG